jgi:hypothetical protein
MATPMAIFWRKIESREPARLAESSASMTREFEVEPLESITIEPETRGDSRSLFRLFFNHRLYADQLTAAEVHGLVGDILERAALPDRAATIPLESLNASNDE